mmetsp:Transcript_24957/g.60024  ORF Transcript_24957/g.60024 Transcript_24957/m.60024 type:complete len:606 (-) Transcript_24957:48-1865(-)
MHHIDAPLDALWLLETDQHDPLWVLPERPHIQDSAAASGLSLDIVDDALPLEGPESRDFLGIEDVLYDGRDQVHGHVVVVSIPSQLFQLLLDLLAALALLLIPFVLKLCRLDLHDRKGIAWPQRHAVQQLAREIHTGALQVHYDRIPFRETEVVVVDSHLRIPRLVVPPDDSAARENLRQLRLRGVHRQPAHVHRRRGLLLGRIGAEDALQGLLPQLLPLVAVLLLPGRELRLSVQHGRPAPLADPRGRLPRAMPEGVLAVFPVFLRCRAFGRVPGGGHHELIHQRGPPVLRGSLGIAAFVPVSHEQARLVRNPLPHGVDDRRVVLLRVLESLLKRLVPLLLLALLVRLERGLQLLLHLLELRLLVHQHVRALPRGDPLLRRVVPQVLVPACVDDRPLPVPLRRLLHDLLLGGLVVVGDPVQLQVEHVDRVRHLELGEVRRFPPGIFDLSPEAFLRDDRRCVRLLLLQQATPSSSRRTSTRPTTLLPRGVGVGVGVGFVRGGGAEAERPDDPEAEVGEGPLAELEGAHAVAHPALDDRGLVVGRVLFLLLLRLVLPLLLSALCRPDGRRTPRRQRRRGRSRGVLRGALGGGRDRRVRGDGGGARP